MSMDCSDIGEGEKISIPEEENNEWYFASADMTSTDDESDDNGVLLSLSSDAFYKQVEVSPPQTIEHSSDGNNIDLPKVTNTAIDALTVSELPRDVPTSVKEASTDTNMTSAVGQVKSIPVDAERELDDATLRLYEIVPEHVIMENVDKTHAVMVPSNPTSADGGDRTTWSNLSDDRHRDYVTDDAQNECDENECDDPSLLQSSELLGYDGGSTTWRSWEYDLHACMNIACNAVMLFVGLFVSYMILLITFDSIYIRFGTVSNQIGSSMMKPSSMGKEMHTTAPILERQCKFPTISAEVYADSDSSSSCFVPPIGSNQNDEWKHVLLVGPTGSGKSTLGNIILGDDYFNSSNALISETDTVSTISSHWQGDFADDLVVSVTDTPGMGDSKGRSNDEILNMIINHSLSMQERQAANHDFDIPSNVVHGIIFVLSMHNIRFDQQTQNIVRAILSSNLARVPGFWNRVIFAFTNCDSTDHIHEACSIRKPIIKQQLPRELCYRLGVCEKSASSGSFIDAKNTYKFVKNIFQDQYEPRKDLNIVFLGQSHTNNNGVMNDFMHKSRCFLWKYLLPRKWISSCSETKNNKVTGLQDLRRAIHSLPHEGLALLDLVEASDESLPEDHFGKRILNGLARRLGVQHDDINEGDKVSSNTAELPEDWLSMM